MQHFYGWKRGLKTGSESLGPPHRQCGVQCHSSASLLSPSASSLAPTVYYLRTKPKADAIQFTVDQVCTRVLPAEPQKQAALPHLTAFYLLQALLAESRAGPTYEEIVAARAAHVAPPMHIDVASAEAAKAAESETLVFGALTSPTEASSPGGKGGEAAAGTAPAGSSPGAGGSSGASDSAAIAKAAARAARSEEMAAIKARMKAGIFDDVEGPSEGCISCGS